ncbi:MAG: GIY-YIG nuclease family protein [Verrucomicrobiota bacterium]
MPRETIILDLLKGEPQGLRVAKFNHSWTGQAFAAPRIELKELLEKPEVDSPGIYFLNGETIKNEPLAYIGVGKSIRNRLKHRKEEFWNQAIVFVGTGGSLHEGHVKYLEGKVIEEAKKVGRFQIINDQASGSPLPDYEGAAMDGFLDRMRILLPVLGCDVLAPIRFTKTETLICKIKGLTANGERTPNGFVVLKGSQAVPQTRPASTEHSVWVINLRKYLTETGVLVSNDKHLLFVKNFEFKSPSAAAAVIRGGNANGLTEWRNEDGITLKQLDELL